MFPDVRGAGLVPGVASSVEPIGFPVDWTGKPGCKLSGEVTPIPGGEPLKPLPWAKVGPLPKNTAIRATISARLMAFLHLQTVLLRWNRDCVAERTAAITPASRL
jgi:hypothetical protein